MNDLKRVFEPNHTGTSSTMRIVVAVQAAIALIFWFLTPFQVLPTPPEVFAALGKMWMEQGLGQELIASFLLNLEALAWTALLSLGICYATVMPFFRPIAGTIAKGRFLGLIGLTFVFTLIVGGGHRLKVSLLVFGMTVFFVTSMAAEIEAIPKSRFDHARTLRMNEWQVVWEVVVLGTIDKAIEVLRQNAAIGWMMLTMVEGISRAEGGVGALLLNQNKHFHLAEVFAIQMVILFVGLMQDYGIGWLKKLVCPYAELTLERK